MASQRDILHLAQESGGESGGVKAVFFESGGVTGVLARVLMLKPRICKVDPTTNVLTPKTLNPHHKPQALIP